MFDIISHCIWWYSGDDLKYIEEYVTYMKILYYILEDILTSSSFQLVRIWIQFSMDPEDKLQQSLTYYLSFNGHLLKSWLTFVKLFGFVRFYEGETDVFRIS